VKSARANRRARQLRSSTSTRDIFLDILKARLLDSRFGDSSMNRAFDDSAVNARHIN
jgi:hypothetical protein